MRQPAHKVHNQPGSVFTDEYGHLWLVLADGPDAVTAAAAVGIAHPEAGKIKHLSRIFIDPDKSIFKNAELTKQF